MAEGEKPELRDSQGRLIDYLRVSVTERCNLRCIYCMPAGPGGSIGHTGSDGSIGWSAGEAGREGREPGEFREPWESRELRENGLSFEELLRCCGVLASLGIRHIKITGGEALLRRGTVPFIAALKKIPGLCQVTMTSNGLLLERDMAALLEAGLDAVNISLDTLDERIFRRLTRHGGLDRVLGVLDAACAAGLPVKVNCVPLKGINDHEVPVIAALARDRPAAVRFIEIMPLGEGIAFEPLGGEETAALLESRYGKLLPFAGKLGNGPARYYRLEGFAGAVGFISPLSHVFCGSCNRLRLSSQGFLRPCLASPLGLDLRSLIRSGADDRTLGQALRDIAARKPAGHQFTRGGEGENEGENEGSVPSLEMFRIGG